MSTYRKERNNIYITLDGASGDYRLDISTGIFYGVKGNPIKTCPRKSEIISVMGRDNALPNLTDVIANMIRYYPNTSYYARFVPYLLGAEKVDALNIGSLYTRNEDFEYIGDHIKELAEFMQENNNQFNFADFKAWVEFEKVKNKLGANGTHLNASMYYALKTRLANITNEELGVCGYYLGRGKMWEYQNKDVRPLVKYLEWCRCMDKEPQRVNNFMREYIETKQTYELRKAEFDNRRIALNYAKHSKAWEFEYGDYTIVVPTCGQDIVTEGERMHHCVGSYVQQVVENSTYICFVRNKANSNIPYITCQVYTNGEIGQYFLAYDRYISSNEDRVFKEAFAEHLRKVWDN